MFNTPELDPVRPVNVRTLYEYSAAFFSTAAQGLRVVEGAVVIELLLDDGLKVMDEVTA